MRKIAETSKAAAIRVLNDNFRSTFVGGQILLTAGAAELPADLKAELLLQVKHFTAFDANNDPHQEHDFGMIELATETYFWKIDYYDPELRFGSENPADPEKTTRVLTIMRADEY